MESKAFELNLDYTFLARSSHECKDSKNEERVSLKERVSRVVTGTIPFLLDVETIMMFLALKSKSLSTGKSVYTYVCLFVS